MVFRGRGKKTGFSKKKRAVKIAKKTSDKDILQDLKIKSIFKSVKQLTASSKAWFGTATTSATYVAIPTIVGVVSDQSMLTHVSQVSVPFIGLGAPGTGTGTGDRVGEYINIKRIQGHYVIRNNASAAGTQNGVTNSVRIIVFCAKKPNGVPSDSAGSIVPSWQDLFAIEGTGGALTRGNIMQPYNPSTRNMYHVYYDRLHVLELTGTANVSDNPQYKGRISFRPKAVNQRVSFNGTGSGVTAVESNCFYFLVMSDSITTADASPPEVSWLGITHFEQ